MWISLEILVKLLLTHFNWLSAFVSWHTRVFDAPAKEKIEMLHSLKQISRSPLLVSPIIWCSRCVYLTKFQFFYYEWLVIQWFATSQLTSWLSKIYPLSYSGLIRKKFKGILVWTPNLIHRPHNRHQLTTCLWIWSGRNIKRENMGVKIGAKGE